MKRIVSYFIKYPITADVTLVLIAVLGIFGLMSMRSTFFPETETTLISIRIVYPGASPEEIEEGVVLKIEDNLSGVTGVERTTSVSQENSAAIVVETKDDSDIDEVLTDVKNAVDQISSFPIGMEPPVIAKQEFLTNAINFALSGDVDLRTLKKFANDIEKDLLASPNISKIDISGFPEEEIVVNVREDDLRRFNLTFDQVVRSVQGENIEISGGTIKGVEEELLIRSKNKNYFAAGFQDIVVATSADGRKVKLYEVADVKDTWSESANSVIVNGRPAAFINVNNTTDENLIGISREVTTYLDDFNQRDLPVKTTVINDGAVTLSQRVDLLTENGTVGFILVLIILALFLQIRLAFWVALAIPISFLGMFILAPIFGVSINILSLFGMILVIGILVDDGIVISENIYRHWEMGKDRFTAAVDGTLEVLPAVLGAILTTMVAFGSFLYIAGTTGQFFSEMAIVVILTLAFSLIEGTFVLPAHISHSKALERKEAEETETQTGFFAAIGNGFDRAQQFFWDLMEWMKMKLYAPSLRFFLRNSVLGLAIPIGLMLLATSLFRGGFVKGTFFPTIEADFIQASLKMPAGTPESVTVDGLIQMEKAVLKVNEKYKSQRADGQDVVTIVSRNIGGGGSGFGGVQDASSLASGGANVGGLFINLLDSEARNIKASQLAEDFRKETGIVYGAESMTYSITGPFGDPVSVSLRSENLSELTLAVNELKAEMGKMSDLRDIRDNNQIGLQEINIQLKEKAKLLGLSPQFVIAQIRQGFFGAEAQRIQRGEDEVKVWVRYSREDRSSIGKLEQMRIRTVDGSSYPLGELADFDFGRGIIAINHLDGAREVRIISDVASSDVSPQEANAYISSTILPPILAKYPSVRFSEEGQARENAKTMNSALPVFGIALMIILTIIILTFRSLSQTIAVGITLPFGFIGVIVGHWILGFPISMLSFLGVFALIGIMVNDALVLVNAFNGLIRDGKSFGEAIYEASLSRFRPIFLTSLTTIFGLIPLIFEKSFQAQFLIPTAISVAFGLAVATFVILITLPVLLVMFNEYKRFILWIWNGEWVPATSIEPAYEGRQNQFWKWAITSFAFIAAIMLLGQIPQLFS